MNKLEGVTPDSKGWWHERDKHRETLVGEYLIRTGLVTGEVYWQFYGLPTFVGRVIGQVHDVRKHVGYSETMLRERGFPTIARVVGGHHAYGQANPYPDGFKETNIFFKMMQKSLALADKVVASMEVRPETETIGIVRKVFGDEQIYNEMRCKFSMDMWTQIEYLRSNLLTGKRILPVAFRLAGEMTNHAQIKV